MGQITVFGGPERRRRWREDERAKILSEAFSPGACVARIARQYDVSTALVYTWRRKAEMQAAASPAEVGFVEAVVLDEAGGTPSQCVFAHCAALFKSSFNPLLSSASISAISAANQRQGHRLSIQHRPRGALASLTIIADRGYDANRIRATLREQGTIPVIPGRRNRKRPIQYDERRYKDRWRVEAMFCRLKDFRRIATRYDKLARNFLLAVSLAAAVAFWI